MQRFSKQNADNRKVSAPQPKPKVSNASSRSRGWEQSQSASSPKRLVMTTIEESPLNSFETRAPSSSRRSSRQQSSSSGAGIVTFKGERKGKKSATTKAPPKPKSVKFADSPPTAPGDAKASPPLTVTTMTTPLKASPINILSPSSNLTASSPLYPDGSAVTEEDRHDDDSNSRQSEPSVGSNEAPPRSEATRDRLDSISEGCGGEGSADEGENDGGSGDGDGQPESFIPTGRAPTSPRSPDGIIEDSNSLGTLETFSTFDGSIDLEALAEIEGR